MRLSAPEEGELRNVTGYTLELSESELKALKIGRNVLKGIVVIVRPDSEAK